MSGVASHLHPGGAAQHAGIRALLVHALHDQAKQYYEHYGFQASAVHPMTLLLRLQQR